MFGIKIEVGKIYGLFIGNLTRIMITVYGEKSFAVYLMILHILKITYFLYIRKVLQGPNCRIEYTFSGAHKIIRVFKYNYSS